MTTVTNSDSDVGVTAGDLHAVEAVAGGDWFGEVGNAVEAYAVGVVVLVSEEPVGDAGEGFLFAEGEAAGLGLGRREGEREWWGDLVWGRW